MSNWSRNHPVARFVTGLRNISLSPPEAAAAIEYISPQSWHQSTKNSQEIGNPNFKKLLQCFYSVSSNPLDDRMAES
jgi:hypothetical protein